MCRFSGQVVIQEIVLPPQVRSRSLAVSGCEVPLASRRLLRLGTRKARRPAINTMMKARYSVALARNCGTPFRSPVSKSAGSRIATRTRTTVIRPAKNTWIPQSTTAIHQAHR